MIDLMIGQGGPDFVTSRLETAHETEIMAAISKSPWMTRVSWVECAFPGRLSHWVKSEGIDLEALKTGRKAKAGFNRRIDFHIASRPRTRSSMHERLRIIMMVARVIARTFSGAGARSAAAWQSPWDPTEQRPPKRPAIGGHLSTMIA